MLIFCKGDPSIYDFHLQSKTFSQSLDFRWVFLSEEVREEDQRQAGTSGHLAQRLQVIWPPSILSDPGAEHRRCSGHINPAADRPLNHPVTQTAREPAFSLTRWLRVASVTWHWSDVAYSRCFRLGGGGHFILRVFNYYVLTLKSNSLIQCTYWVHKSGTLPQPNQWSLIALKRLNTHHRHSWNTFTA